MAVTSTSTDAQVTIAAMGNTITNVARAVPTAATVPAAPSGTPALADSSFPNSAANAQSIVTVTLGSAITVPWLVGDIIVVAQLGDADDSDNPVSATLNGRHVIASVVDSTHITWVDSNPTAAAITSGAEAGTIYVERQVVLPNGRTYLTSASTNPVTLSIEEFTEINPAYFGGSHPLLSDTTS